LARLDQIRSDKRQISRTTASDDGRRAKTI
jgi:hypothetical protein